MLQKVAILFHPRKPEAITEAEWLATELRARGIDIYLDSGWKDETTINSGCCGRDLAVVFGGDGTIILVARDLGRCGVPVLGINMGRVGFLADISPQALRKRVDELANGSFWIERRSMLEVELKNGDSVETFCSLNEVAVARGLEPRAVHVRVLLDGDDFTTYTADAVLVATATGSTAYSLAAGGPILYPESESIILTPVAPHLHIGRSIILPKSMAVSLSVLGERPAVMSVDGFEERTLGPEDTVHVRRSELRAQFARLGPCTYFYEAIAQRLR